MALSDGVRASVDQGILLLGERHMAVPQHDLAALIMAALEADVAVATAKAIRKLRRLPTHVRRQLDPYGLLLRPRGQGARRQD